MSWSIRRGRGVLVRGLVIRVIGAITGIGLIHYAFVRDRPEAGFYGIILLALLGMMSRARPVRLVFLAVGAVAVFGASGYGGADTGRYLLLAVPIVMHLAAMLVFGLTLLPGRVPLITHFSKFDHHPRARRLSAHSEGSAGGAGPDEASW